MNHSKMLVMSTLAVMSTLTVAVALSVSRMPGEVVSPISRKVAWAVPRSNENDKDRNCMVKGKQVLSAKANKDNFKPGEPIILKLTLSNESDQEIYIVETSPVRDNKLEVQGPTGEKVPLTEKGKQTLESPVLRRFVSRIGPGQVVQSEINVLELYDLTADSIYTVTAKRKVLMQDKETSVELQSNPVKVIVQQ